MGALRIIAAVPMLLGANPAHAQDVQRAPSAAGQPTPVVTAGRLPVVGNTVVGERQRAPASATKGPIGNPLARIDARLQTRVQNRLQTRLDQAYRPQGNAGDAYSAAQQEVRATPRRRR